jgi:hypothetical protein
MLSSVPIVLAIIDVSRSFHQAWASYPGRRSRAKRQLRDAVDERTLGSGVSLAVERCSTARRRLSAAKSRAVSG